MQSVFFFFEFGFYFNFAVAEFVLCATAEAASVREKRVELKIQHEEDNDLL